MDKTPIILSTRKLTKSVPALDGGDNDLLHILRGVDMEIKSGESVAILGTSGSGKSTLLGLMAGLDTPTSGRVIVDNVVLNELDEDGLARLRAEKSGFVFQSFHLLANLTALENVMLPLELQGNRNARHHANDLLARVGLSERLQHYPSQLSGGEQQRVAIARAFVTSPAIVFADEPTGNLDARTGRMVIELLFAMNRENNTTLVMVTHDENLASQCQRTFVLDNGVIKENVND